MLLFRSIRLARPISCSARALRKGCPPDGDGEGRGRDEAGCDCQAQETECEPKVPKKPKKAGLQCGSAGERGAAGPFREQGVPDHCSKDKALECARKLQELQKMWESVADASDPGARAAPAKDRGCPPRPPAREGGGAPPALLLLAAAALAAAAVWWAVASQEDATEGKEGA